MCLLMINKQKYTYSGTVFKSNDTGMYYKSDEPWKRYMLSEMNQIRGTNIQVVLLWENYLERTS